MLQRNSGIPGFVGAFFRRYSHAVGVRMRMPAGYSQAKGLGGGAWDEQVGQTWVWGNGVKRGAGNCLNEVSFARPSLAFSHFSKSLVSPRVNPQRPHPIPSPYLYEYLIFPNLDIPPKPLYNLKSDNMS